MLWFLNSGLQDGGDAGGGSGGASALTRQLMKESKIEIQPTNPSGVKCVGKRLVGWVVGWLVG